jgi:hypothetical protein
VLAPDSSLLYKAAETVRTLAARRPSVATLRENRRQRFQRAHAILPSTAAVGEELSLTLQARDQCERLHADFRGRFSVGATDADATHPEQVVFPPDNGGVTAESGISFGTPGTHYLTLVRASTGRRFVSNPVRVTDGEPDTRLYWGDLHLHSSFSDGCGSVREGLCYGRDVMALDVVAYTDHDTMGFFIPPRLQRRRMRRRYFDRTREAVADAHDPGEFVTLLSYEWTKQPLQGGHVNVYFDGVEGAQLFDSISPRSDTYEELWDRLREFNDRGGTQAVTIPHHTAESTFPFDFSAVEYDDDLAPLVEVYSQWGSSERPAGAGNRHPVEMGQGEADRPGFYTQDAHRLGYRVGLTASSDYHGPHPGHSLIHAEPHLPSLDEWRRGGLGWGNVWRVWDEPSYPGGLQAMYAPELTREAVFESIVQRRVYGTTQPDRIVVDFRVDGVRFGDRNSTVTLPAPDAPREVSLDVAGTAPVATARVVKNNDVWRTARGSDDPDADLDSYTVATSWTDDAPVTGMRWDDGRGTDADVYYARIRQADGGMAWAGPLWVECYSRS